MTKLMDDFFASVQYNTTKGDWRKMPETEPPEDDVESEDIVEDENPNHDPHTGEFASGGGSLERKQLKSNITTHKVLFEVAPNPDDKELTARWGKIDENTRTEISVMVAHEILPEVLKIAGLKDGAANFHMQYGGFEDESNPSLSLLLDKSVTDDQADQITRVLGSVLEQKSMASVSDKPFKGSFEMGAVVVAVPKNVGYKQLKIIYNKLRTEVTDQNGKQLINGHTTDDGRMVILVDKGTEESIGKQVAQCLGEQYEVGSDTLNVSWPEQGEDDYGLRGKNQTVGSSAQPSIRREVDSLRTQASDKRLQHIRRYEEDGTI